MNSSNQTFLFHDYETTGTSKQLDRPTQFAAVRTDFAFNIVGEPVMIYCKPHADNLVNPYAALITGITPQECKAKGVSESEFAQKVNEEFSVPNTCGVGYNSITFDDEMTRNLFYRNFINPYDREFMNGGSRWDLFTVAKLFSLLRPEGIVWPTKEDGRPSLKLENLIKANNLQQEKAHDALSDVLATIELAKFFKEKDPELFEYCLGLRVKSNVASLVNLEKPRPFVFMAPFYKNRFSILYPVATDTTNKNSILCVAISDDISRLKVLSAEGIADLLYKKKEDLDEGEQKIPLQEIQINKVPSVASFKMLRMEDKGRLDITDDLIFEMRERYEYLANSTEIAQKIQEAFAISKSKMEKSSEPEMRLYDGFPSYSDKKIIESVKTVPIDELDVDNFSFDDKKYNELLFRYKARNSLHTMSDDHKHRWLDYCKNKLFNETDGTSITLDKFDEYVNEIEADSVHKNKDDVIPLLREWSQKVRNYFTKMASLPKVSKLKIS